MEKFFLRVNKDLFTMGLNPVEILILAQVMEFQTNTGDCFISDKQLAEQFGVSESTISRELKKLEGMGLIARETKNIKGGKERHIKATTGNLTIVEENKNSTTSNLTVDNKQIDICTRVNLPIDNKQNDSIKDNNKKINLKENGIDKEKEIPVEEEEGTAANPIIVSREWLVARSNNIIRAENGDFLYWNKYYRMEG